MTGQLKYLSDLALSELRKSIRLNHERYRTTDFLDVSDNPGWDIGLGVEYDEELLATLDKRNPRNVAPIDLSNSRIVGQALANLTPTLANEERIWVRLAHVEALDYARARWVKSGCDTEALVKAVDDHFFASSQTAIRDDQALSRLWWNYQIAKTCMPEDVDGALGLILKTADIRSNFVERIWMTSRQRIATSVLAVMRSDPWVVGAELNFREFMKALNRLGGGIVFEALDDSEIRSLLAECVGIAKKAV